jgi:hypothetical protein
MRPKLRNSTAAPPHPAVAHNDTSSSSADTIFRLRHRAVLSVLCIHGPATDFVHINHRRPATKIMVQQEETARAGRGMTFLSGRCFDALHQAY